MTGFASELADLLAQGRQSYDVPGASVAVYHDGATFTAASGVLNKDTNYPVTPESAFQIGSVTKTLTSVLMMQLVDDSVLDLDTPIKSYLPTFAVQDPKATSRITVRHLLTHSSGLEGDFLIESGRGDGCLANYVQQCRLLPQAWPVGSRFSYCNTGFIIAGRLIEVLTGRTWDQAIKDKLFQPLEMNHAATLPEDLVGRSAAMGHVPDPGNAQSLVAHDHAYALPVSGGPAGTTPAMSATDLLKFAVAISNGGVGLNGMRLLSSDATETMLDVGLSVGGYLSSGAVEWGLGWAWYDWAGHMLLGHDGNTVGQRAFMRIDPASNTVVTLLTNSETGWDLCRDVFGHVFAQLAGIRQPSLKAPEEAIQVDPNRYAGTYEHFPGYSEIQSAGRGIKLSRFDEGGPRPDLVVDLDPVEPGLFTFNQGMGNLPDYLHFADFGKDGSAGSFLNGYRWARRRQD